MTIFSNSLRTPESHIYLTIGVRFYESWKGEGEKEGGEGGGEKGGGHNIALLESGRASSLSYERKMRINIGLAQVVFFYIVIDLFLKLGRGSRLIWQEYLGIYDSEKGGG